MLTIGCHMSVAKSFEKTGKAETRCSGYAPMDPRKQFETSLFLVGAHIHKG